MNVEKKRYLYFKKKYRKSEEFEFYFNFFIKKPMFLKKKFFLIQFFKLFIYAGFTNYTIE